MADEGLAELSVMAVGREHRGLVVPQMAQPVSGQLIAAHSLDQPRHLPGAPAHQGPLQAGQALAV